jgi:hypothetical protein
MTPLDGPGGLTCGIFADQSQAAADIGIARLLKQTGTPKRQWAISCRRGATIRGHSGGFQCAIAMVFHMIAQFERSDLAADVGAARRGKIVHGDPSEIICERPP